MATVKRSARKGAALLDRMINQQAQIIAYNNDFRLLALVTVPAMLLLFLMRRHEETPAPVVPSPGATPPVVTMAPAVRKALA